MTFAVTAGVAYDTDLERAERIAMAVAEEVQAGVPGAVADAIPEVNYLSFGPQRVTFEVVLTARDIEAMGPVRHELVKRLHQRFRAARIRMSDRRDAPAAPGDASAGHRDGISLAHQVREGVES